MDGTEMGDSPSHLRAASSRKPEICATKFPVTAAACSGVNKGGVDDDDPRAPMWVSPASWSPPRSRIPHRLVLLLCLWLMLSRLLDPGHTEEALVLPAPLGARKNPVRMCVLGIAGSWWCACYQGSTNRSRGIGRRRWRSTCKRRQGGFWMWGTVGSILLLWSGGWMER